MVKNKLLNLHTIWGLVNFLIGAYLWKVLFLNQFDYSETVIFGQNLASYMLGIIVLNLLLVILIVFKNQIIFAFILNFLTLLLLIIVVIQIYQ